MEELSERLLGALGGLDEVATNLEPDEAARVLDEATLQEFWRVWPRLGAWAGALWRRLNEDLGEPATPLRDPELDEVGGAEG